MSKKVPVILPLATALAALGASPITTAEAAINPETVSDVPSKSSNAVTELSGQVMYYDTGLDLFSFVMTERADGTLVAVHRSHSSHSSHSSHRSHQSSRY